MHWSVTVPASTSNLGPGFDCLGLALDLALRVEFVSAPHGVLTIEVTGPEARAVPTDASNLVWTTLRDTLQRRGGTPQGAHLRVDNAIPLARGLGSSGAAITAGVTLAHLMAHGHAERDALLVDAARVEGHPDNVAPQVLGGFVAALSDGGRVHTAQLPLPRQLEIALVIPEFEVPTHEARRILPDPVSRADAVFNVAHVALLCGALQADDDALLKIAMQDRLHERHRAALVPGLDAALASLRAESRCVAAAISGSGPTLLAFYRKVPADAGREACVELQRRGIAARVQRLRPQTDGVQWSRLET